MVASKLPVLVTGANAGIGLGLVRLLIAHPQGYHVFLCCRDTAKGQAALDSLPQSTPGSAEVLKLDVTSSEDIAAAAKTIASRCPDGLYALVNNAGVGTDLPFSTAAADPNTAYKTMATNYYGAIAVIDALLPYIRPGGRIVNVTSGLGPMTMERLSDEKRQDLLRADLTEAEVTAHVEQYCATFAEEVTANNSNLPRLSGNGYWLQAYGFSKAALNAWTRVFATGRGSRYIVAACCPGFVRTHMTREYDTSQTLRTPEEGAATPFWLITENTDKITGRFWSPDHELREW